jgi:hypothetical protein
MKAQGIRVTVDSQPNSLGKKIRNAEIAKVRRAYGRVAASLLEHVLRWFWMRHCVVTLRFLAASFTWVHVLTCDVEQVPLTAVVGKAEMDNGTLASKCTCFSQ